MNRLRLIFIFIIVGSVLLHGCGGGNGGGADDASNTPSSDVNSDGSGDGEDMVLSAGYEYESIFRSRLAGLTRIARSQNGKIYIQHKADSGATRISVVDIDNQTLSTVADLNSADVEPFIVGGPGDSFIAALSGEIRRYEPDGAYSVWGEHTSGTPVCYADDGRLIGFDNGDIVEMRPDGSSRTLVDDIGITVDDDLAVAGDGTLFIADTVNGELFKIDANGNRTYLADIAKDPCHIWLTTEGNLYVTNVAFGFVQVDTETGAFTTISNETNNCYVKCPADFVIDDAQRVIFAAWADTSMSWYDLDSGRGQNLFKEDWANTAAAALGPDDKLYLGLSQCDSGASSKVVRFSADGERETFLPSVNGLIQALALDAAGGLYFTAAVNQRNGLYYASGMDADPVNIPLAGDVELASIAFDPMSGRLFGSVLAPDNSRTTLRIVEIGNQEGILAEHSITLPQSLTGIGIMAAPDGKLFARAEESERWATGPVVERYILEIDLNANAAGVFAQVDLMKCCPLTNASIDAEGTIWWILNPDFYLYQVLSTGETRMFAEHTPVDAGSVFRTSTGDLLINYPDGIMRIFQNGN